MSDERNEHEETEMLNLNEGPPENKESLPHDANEILPGKVKKSLALKISGGILAVVIIAAIIYGVISNSTSAILISAIKNTGQAAVSSEPLELLKSVFTQGSLELALDLGKVTDMMPGINLEGQVSAKYISNLKDNQAALRLALEDGSSTLADAVLHANKDEIVLASDILFGKTAYGIGLNDFARNLESSVFNPDNGGYYTLDDELYEILADIDPKGTATKYSEFEKVLGKTVDEAFAALYKSIKTNVGIKKGTDTVQFVDTTSKVTVLSISADAKKISAVLREMFEWMNSSENVRLLLNKAADISSPLLDGMGEDPDEFVENFYDKISVILEDYDDITDELENAEAEIDMKLYITKKGRQLVKIEFEVDSYDERNQAEIVAGPSLNDVELISLTFRRSGGRTFSPEKYTYSYTVEENDTNSYSAKLQLRGDTTKSSASITWDKKDGDFRIKADNGATIKGTMLYKKNILTMEVRSITNDWQSINPGLTVTLNKQDTTPIVPTYTDILNMDEDDFEYLGNDIAENVTGFIDEIGDAAYWMSDLFY